MKRNFSLILIFLAYFFTMNIVCCGEDFFIDTNFTESKNKMELPGKKKSKFNFFNKKEKKKTQFNYVTNQEEEIPQGYYGTLPNIEADFKYKQQHSATSKELDFKKIDEDEELNEQNLKPAPVDDALFLDMVIKKEKNSNKRIK